MIGRSFGDERGDTLIEVLLAVVILGIAGVAIMTGLQLTAKISGTDRRQSAASTYVRDFAETIETTVAGGGYNASGSYTYSPGGGYTATLTALCATASSEVSGTGPSWTSCPAGGDLQQLALKVTAPNGVSSETLTIVVRKPCNGSC